MLRHPGRPGDRIDPRARKPACRGRSFMRAGCTTWSRISSR